MLHHSWTLGSKCCTVMQTTFLPLRRLKSDLAESAKRTYNHVKNSYVLEYDTYT